MPLKGTFEAKSMPFSSSDPVSGTCGASFRENCTYFESPATVSAGACAFEVCRCQPGVCQVSRAGKKYFTKIAVDRFFFCTAWGAAKKKT